MHPVVVAHLRSVLPDIGTRDLEQQWLFALAALTALGELGHPCSMGVDTRRTLFKTIRAMGATEVLDIGTFTGTSALAFALAVGCGGSVVSVDIQPANAPDGYWKKWQRPCSPADLMVRAGIADRVEFVQADSVEYLQATTRQFDFICLDGWHEERAVYAEIPLALERLRPGGLIFLDDVQPPGYVPPPGADLIAGPALAVARHLREGAPLRVHPVPPAAAFLLNAA